MPKDKLQSLTDSPGVYRMLDKKGQVLYVGKAKNLKKRVSSYFRKNVDSIKTEVLMSQVVDFEVTITTSENEALLLEALQIKKYKPRYNVIFRDDKSYPYLFLSSEHPFPRLDYHRGTQREKGLYFGPYPNAGAVRDNLALIQKLFKIRQCTEIFFANRTRPCLQYQIQRCTAPCVGYVSKEDYADQVKQAILFLEGNNEEIVKVIAAKMERASNQHAYEEAAIYRDQIMRLRRLQSKQYMNGDDVDIVACEEKQGQLAVAILFIRGGRLIGHKTFFPKVPVGTEPANALAEFIPQYYLSPMRGEHVIKRIILSQTLPDKSWIEDALREQLHSKLSIHDRPIEKYKKWQQLAKSNALFSLTQQLAEKNNVTHKIESLQSALTLPNCPQRIECFDISHTMGEETVASCVVYGESGALTKEYRRFNIKGITPGDDYAAMRQAILRRYTRVKEGDGVLPDLLIIDGGLGQLRQAAEALEEIQVSGVILLGISKGPSRKVGLENLHIWGRDKSIHLKPDDIAFHLIQFIRDEAHRFAITAHRKKRAKKSMDSPLEHIEGIGAKRRQALLKHFGGWRELSRAGVNDIAKVPGISEELAQKIYDALR